MSIVVTVVFVAMGMIIIVVVFLGMSKDKEQKGGQNVLSLCFYFCPSGVPNVSDLSPKKDAHFV